MKVKELIQKLIEFPMDSEFEMYSYTDMVENIRLEFGYMRYSKTQEVVIVDIKGKKWKKDLIHT